MDPAPIGSTPAAAPAPAPAVSAPQAGVQNASSGDALAAATTDFETFLTLLTAQMRNQDPLKPVESTEFVAQLASFSAVEQQIGTNERLDALMDAMNGGSGSGLAEWIGKEVRAAAPTRFDGEAIEISTEPAAGAAVAALVVRDASGAPISRIAVDPTAETLTWSGETSDGTAPAGTYSFDIEYASQDGPIASVQGQVFATVREVRLGGDVAPRLGLAGGGEVSSEAVTAVRDPAEAGEV